MRRHGDLRPAALAWVVVVACLTLAGCGESHGRTCPGEAGPDMSERAVTGRELTQGELRCANLERSTLDSEVVREAKLSGSNLHRAHLNGASLENVDLSGADLTDASVESATLTGVDFVRADLGKASLADSRLRDVGLTEARLEGTNLRGIVATRSDLAGADVRDADLTGAWFKRHQPAGRPPGRRQPHRGHLVERGVPGRHEVRGEGPANVRRAHDPGLARAAGP